MRAPNLEVLAASEICATSFEEGLALFMPASWLGWEDFIGGSCSLGRMQKPILLPMLEGK